LHERCAFLQRQKLPLLARESLLATKNEETKTGLERILNFKNEGAPRFWRRKGFSLNQLLLDDENSEEFFVRPNLENCSSQAQSLSARSFRHFSAHLP
jgi:hypothetical protein